MINTRSIRAVHTTSRKHRETVGDIRDLGGTAAVELNCALSGGRLIGNPGRRAIAPVMFLLTVRLQKPHHPSHLISSHLISSHHNEKKIPHAPAFLSTLLGPDQYCSTTDRANQKHSTSILSTSSSNTITLQLHKLLHQLNLPFNKKPNTQHEQCA